MALGWRRRVGENRCRRSVGPVLERIIDRTDHKLRLYEREPHLRSACSVGRKYGIPAEIP
jgi:hypothetical protein